MGLFDQFRNLRETTIRAELAPEVNKAVAYTPFGQSFEFSVTREVAMQVPAIARARNVICNTLGSIPLEMYARDGRQMRSLSWMEQPDLHTPRSVTMAYTIDSLMFFGKAYWQVTNTYAEDNRPSRFRWIDTRRVTFITNTANTQIEQYSVDNNPVPMSGIGSLITFQALDDLGVLGRGARTIATSHALEVAAYNISKDPVPVGILKNTGFDMADSAVVELLNTWKQARQNKSTAYLNSNLEYQTVGFDSKQMQLVEARAHIASEIARLMNVPAYVVGADMQANMTYSNAVDTRKDLVNNTLRGYIAAIEDRLNMADISTSGSFIRFDLDDYLREDAKTRTEITTSLLTSGIIDVNEAREMEDLAPRGSESADEA
jgi:HK97 family phage portal protein